MRFQQILVGRVKMNTGNIGFRSNNVGDIISLFHEKLDGIYGDGEVRVFVEMLFEAFEGWDKVALLLNRGATINQSDLLRFHWALEDLKRQRPIQHIIGWVEFCGCRIGVDETTLIPRPETEEIVSKTIALFEERPPRRVLDICTGSGCIAIALAKAWPEAEIMAVDVSEEALAKARKNADENGVKVDFVRCDLLKDEPPLPYPFDLIISNPPYVCESERETMRANVLDYEPELALFVPDEDALVFYRRIAAISRKMLIDKGTIILEINERFGKETLEEMKKEGLYGKVERDFRGKDRIIIAERRQ